MFSQMEPIVLPPGGGSSPPPTTDYTRLLLHQDTIGLNDSSSHQYPVTLTGGVARSGLQYKFGNYSAYFNGVDGVQSIPDSDDWDFGAQNSTIEMFIRPDIITSQDYLCGQWQDSSNFWFIQFDPTNGFALYAAVGGTPLYTPAYFTQGSVTISALTWYHIALIIQGTTINLYQDGVPVITTTISATYPNIAAPLRFGMQADPANQNPYQGFVDEVRVSHVARDPGDFPPTSPYMID